MEPSDRIEIYRETTIGRCLQEVLDKFTEKGQITENLKTQTLKMFDLSIANALHNKGRFKAFFNATELVVYSLANDLWKIKLKNVDIGDTSHWFDCTVGVGAPRKSLVIFASDGRESTRVARRRCQLLY